MKEIFIERQRENVRIVLRENNHIKELFIEEDNKSPQVGEIYVGMVKNIIPAIKSAFVDIGWNKNAYLYLDKKFNNTHIKKGDYILVEVVKEDLNKKGPKVTNAITIPGRYTVLQILNNEITFSHKIKDEKIKAEIQNNIVKPKDVGILIRTEAINTSIEDINNEIRRLYKIYSSLIEKSKYKMNTGVLFQNGGIVGKILRDKLNDNISKIYLNCREDYVYVSEFLKEYGENNIKLDIYEGERNLLDYYAIEKEILSLRNKKVYLNCGGYIIIDKTEAMYVVDVNSGKNVKGNSMEKTIFTTNMEAADEICNQIILRNLNGIIVIDFIDMDNENLKEKVLDKLKQGLKRDKNKSVVYPFTELNLVQIARKRQGKTIYDYIEQPCKCCSGKGSIVSFAYMRLLIRNEIINILNMREIKDIYIELNKRYKDYIDKNRIQFISEIEALEKNIYINYIDAENQYKVEPLIFKNQIEDVKDLKIY
ncbi:Rne/Rng family ribonuclease [Clostridium botulinum]|uniref:Ribonuclease E/G n=1 Tax=Clostridium botulinum TaxID=1491 RepID=A0A846J1C9_CLOBO|nr:ribonuclease E/G [Clostridium botulinum]ACA54804.1 ribonuclease, Rne/Rng family [Clostridium botulinum A3 str. Loch Maree]NFH67387.1 ribonuclease E/G [Clostridium botulinum]NFJ07846.1 ribonuclease E/G [Clostridium botulinum]NFK13364.1 ribonuclease E/G [Clostridium botulinum]NFM94771.1 ribonuclease E/G [Clostridium botulinum]